MSDPPDLDDVRQAAARIEGKVVRTPVLRGDALDELVGARVLCKAEHLQRAGSFKLRGATNAVLALDDETAARGVAAHSSGNHAAALALAARSRGVPCHVVMPRDAPRVKFDAVVRYGATVVECDPTMAARAAALAEVVARTGATEIHPYDNPLVIAGQGTATLELLEEVPDIRLVVAPVSGGGLLSGTAIAAHGIDPTIRVVGGEPRNVDDAARSLAAGVRTSEGNTTSIADGLLATLSDRTFEILRAHDVEIVTVTESEILDAMQLIEQHLAQRVEPSAATALAALLTHARAAAPLPPTVALLLSGGNLDP